VNAYPEVLLENDNRGLPPLHYAAKAEYSPHLRIDIVNILGCRYLEALFMTDDNGMTPLDLLNLDNIFQALPLIEWSYQAVGDLPILAVSR